MSAPNNDIDWNAGVTDYVYLGWRIRFRDEWLYNVTHDHPAGDGPMLMTVESNELVCYNCKLNCPPPVWQHLMAVKKLLCL